MNPDLFKMLESATAPAVYLFAAWYLAKRLDAMQERVIALLSGIVVEATTVMREVRETLGACKGRNRE